MLQHNDFDRTRRHARVEDHRLLLASVLRLRFAEYKHARTQVRGGGHLVLLLLRRYV